jgi:hypothetical protein
MDHPPEHRDAFAGARMVRIGDDYFEGLFVRSMSLAYRESGKRKRRNGPAYRYGRKTASGPQGRFAPLRGGLRPSLTATLPPCVSEARSGRRDGPFDRT